MRKILMVAFAAAVLLVFYAGAQGTAALWRASGQSAPGTVTTGSLSLGVGAGTSVDLDFAFDGLDTSTLAPGGFVQAPLSVGNTGTTALRYGLAGATSGTTTPGSADAALASAVELSVHAVANTSACPAGGPAVGALLYRGPVADSAMFAQRRALTASGAGSSETLCVSVALPANTPQAAAGGKLRLVLKWRGDQL